MIAVIGMELSRLQMNIVSLQEIRLPDSSSVKEKYFSFFWQGKPLNETRKYGVGFAVRNILLKSIVPPIVGSERILSLQLHSSAEPVTLISAYAPTLSSMTDVKNKFWQLLSKQSLRESRCSFSETLTLELVLITTLGSPV